jgi:hypothetical protein
VEPAFGAGAFPRFGPARPQFPDTHRATRPLSQLYCITICEKFGCVKKIPPARFTKNISKMLPKQHTFPEKTSIIEHNKPYALDRRIFRSRQSCLPAHGMAKSALLRHIFQNVVGGGCFNVKERGKGSARTRYDYVFQCKQTSAVWISLRNLSAGTRLADRARTDRKIHMTETGQRTESRTERRPERRRLNVRREPESSFLILCLMKITKRNE